MRYLISIILDHERKFIRRIAFHIRSAFIKASLHGLRLIIGLIMSARVRVHITVVQLSLLWVTQIIVTPWARAVIPHIELPLRR